MTTIAPVSRPRTPARSPSSPPIPPTARPITIPTPSPVRIIRCVLLMAMEYGYGVSTVNDSHNKRGPVTTRTPVPRAPSPEPQLFNFRPLDPRISFGITDREEHVATLAETDELASLG